MGSVSLRDGGDVARDGQDGRCGDLRQAAAGREVTRPAGQLVVLHAADDALAVGVAFPLQPVTSIGRSPANTISIPDTYASAHHTLLTWREGQWWLQDRDSRNGTLLNDVSVETATVLSSGDELRFGRVRMRFEAEEAA